MHGIACDIKLIYANACDKEMTSHFFLQENACHTNFYYTTYITQIYTSSVPCYSQFSISANPEVLATTYILSKN